MANNAKNNKIDIIACFFVAYLGKNLFLVKKTKNFDH